MQDSFRTKAHLTVGAKRYTIYSLEALEKEIPAARTLCIAPTFTSKPVATTAAAIGIFTHSLSLG